MDSAKEAAINLSPTDERSIKTEEAAGDSPSFPSAKGELKVVDPDELQTDYSSKAKNQPTLSAYLRIFTYSTPRDRILLFLGFFGQIAVGITLPLMNIVFGHLVGNFASYFTPGSTTTKAQFLHGLSKQTLYIVYLFIARWVLSYCSSKQHQLPNPDPHLSRLLLALNWSSYSSSFQGSGSHCPCFCSILHCVATDNSNLSDHISHGRPPHVCQTTFGISQRAFLFALSSLGYTS